MAKRILIILVTLIGFAATVTAQPVIVTDVSTYTSGASTAVLDVNSTTKGLLSPRMTSAQRTAISSPATGLLVFQTDGTPGFYYYNGSAWVIITTGAATISATAPITYTSGAIGITQSSTSGDGYLSSTDWNTFNNKVATTRTISTTSPLSGGGDLSASRTITIADAAADGSTKGAATFTAADFTASSGLIGINYTSGQAASGSAKGFLTSTDWTTFNNKVATSRSISTSGPLSGGGDLSANRTITIADAAADGSTKGAATFTAADFNTTSGVVSIDYTNGQAASGSAKGFLTSTDWTTFNNKVPTTLTINTTGPLSGGGDLSTNRTLSIANAAADGTTKGASTYTASDFTATSGLIGINYTSGQAASTSTKGFLTSTDWNTFNNKPSAASVWSVTGNSGIIPVTNFIGTTDSKSLRFRTNNVERMIIDSTGKIGIGTSSPATALHVSGTNPLTLTGVQAGAITDSVMTIASGVVRNLPFGIVNNTVNAVIKTANDTIKKTETFVLAKNSINLVFPVITSADDGLSITVKNGGIYTDLVTLVGNSGAKIDSLPSMPLAPWYAFTFVAKGGNWYTKDRGTVYVNKMIVSWASPWNTIDKAIAFLNAHMWGPAIIEVESGNYNISSTINISLPYPVTIEGSSYGSCEMNAATGLAGAPMFSCATECYFKMLDFEGSTLSGYGNSAGEDAIHFTGSNTYHEIKDCDFHQFNKAIVMQNNEELWLFESDIRTIIAAGVEVAAGTSTGVIFKTSEVDFTDCEKGVNLVSGVGATVSITNGGFYNSSGTSNGINYVPASFTSIGPVFISNNIWNNTGSFINGFDFTRTDGRDASVSIVNNVGIADQRANCKVNVLNNATTVSVGSTWVKANWNTSNQTQIVSKFTVATNKITYQPQNHRDLVMWISGNVSCATSNTTINIGIVKNAVSSTRYGETTVRTATSTQPYQWSTVVFIPNVAPGDYFEVWAQEATGGPSTYTFQDMTWYTDSQ